MGQEATVRILYGTTDWLRTEKGVQQSWLLSFCLLNLYAEHILRNARLDELQAGIKGGRRNINNLTYADLTVDHSNSITLTAESEEEMKNLLMRVKEESETASSRINTKNLRSWHPAPSLHGKQKGER